MLELLSLPNEVLLIIIRTVLPADIENFSKSCEILHSLSKDVLRQHEANKEKYSKITLGVGGAWYDNPKAIHPLLMIRDILQNNRVALYPIEVVIKDTDERCDVNEPGGIGAGSRKTLSEVSRTLAQYDGEIFSLLTNCPYLDSSEVAKWQKGIRRINGATVAFLLTILPNVESIKICYTSFDDDFLREMIDKISRAIYDLSSDVRQLTALNNVSHVTVDGRGGMPRNHTLRRDLSLLGLFAGLPSIRSINGRGIDGRTFQRQRRPGRILVPYSPSLREVHLTNNLIGPHVLKQLLRSIRRLQSFTYSSEYCIDGETFEPRDIIGLLRTYARFSLLQLDITACYRTSRISFSGNFVESLRAFEVLERVRIDAEMFMKCPPKSREPQLLTGMLSASVKELELVGSIDEQDASLMFAGLSTAKEKSCLNLRKVVFQCLIPLSKTMQAECETAGISLEIVN